MTRCDSIQTSAVGATLPATEPCADMVIIGTDKTTFTDAKHTQHQDEKQPSNPFVTIQALSGNAIPITNVSRKSKSP